ncbi:MAG: hypothetical protein IAE91_01595 [Ignavibacteriaceae bacterium]|nr:hypothetical protein [Ignavibacteriaceae bacterium]
MKQKYLLITLLSFLLTGCLEYNQETDINHDGSGRIKFHYSLKAVNADSSNNFLKTGYFDNDTLTLHFTSPYYLLKGTDTYFMQEDSTLHAIVEIEFKHVDSLNKSDKFPQFHFDFMEGSPGQKIFTQTLKPGYDFNGMLKNEKYHLKFEFGFPGEIIEHNAQLEKDKKLYWEFLGTDLVETKYINVTFKPFKIVKTPLWIYGLSAFVLIVVIYFLFRKKRD